MSDGLGDVAVAGSRRTDQQGVPAVSDELATDQLIDFFFRQFRVEPPVELRQCGPFFKSGGLEAGFNETRVSAVQLIGDQASKHLCEGVTLVGLGDPCMQGADHAMKAKRLEVFFDFR